MKIETRLFHGPSDWGWIKQHIPLLRVEDTCGIMAIDEEKNETVGAVIFDNFLSNSAQVSIVLKNSMVLRHGYLEECFTWIFNKIGKDYLYVLVHEKNEPSLRLSHGLGFREKMRIKEGFKPGIDFIVKELHRDRCTFIEKIREVA